MRLDVSGCRFICLPMCLSGKLVGAFSLETASGLSRLGCHSSGKSEALDRARRGEIHAFTMTFVRGTDFASGDLVVVDNMALAMILLGATEVAKSKIVQGARDAQNQQAAPSSKIIRPGGARVG
jgi:hypothetical protein